MNNLIYRNQVIEAISELPVKVDNLGYTWMIAGDVLKQIDDIPSVELEERTAKVSNQILNNSNPYTVGAWIGTCECGELVSYSSKYCHMCGARLDWSRNE